MLEKLLTRKSSLGEAAFLIAAASLLSRVLGLFRDRLLSGTFGATDPLDAYVAAFRVPDFIFNLLVIGAISSAFIPVITDYLNGDEENGEVWHITASIINISLLGLVVVLGLTFIFAPQIVKYLIVPGFNPQQMELTTMLTRIMLLGPLFFGVSSIIGGVLNIFKNFLVYSLAPVVYNLGIIAGIVFLAPRFGIGGVAIGVVVGALMHMLIQIPSFFRLGFRYRPVFDIKHRAVLKISQLMIPRVLAMATQQINLIVNVAIGSSLAVGSLTVFYLANNLQHLPISLFGVSLATAVFPILAKRASSDLMIRFSKNVMTTLTKILFFIVPTTFIMLLLRAHIVRLIYGVGNFGWEETRFTVSVLSFFMLGMFAQALIPLLAKSFYALKNTITPLWVGALSVALNVALALVLVGYLKIVGLALAFSIAGIVNAVLLYLFLRKNLKNIVSLERLLTIKVVKIFFASIAMGGVMYAMLYIVDAGVDTHTYIGLFIQAAISLLAGATVFVSIAEWLGLKETQMILRPIRRILGGNGEGE